MAVGGQQEGSGSTQKNGARSYQYRSLRSLKVECRFGSVREPGGVSAMLLKKASPPEPRAVLCACKNSKFTHDIEKRPLHWCRRILDRASPLSTAQWVSKGHLLHRAAPAQPRHVGLCAPPHTSANMLLAVLITEIMLLPPSPGSC